ncbi:MAG: DUF4143 domain-containing protein [Lachnospiraceae bacterium]|nr:DUF4143 domain-containing protein [Lachnospiraceae bacterium]
MEYIRRIMDDEIDKRAKAFNAINIVGPKGCGKTRTAKERCKTTIEFQDEERRQGYLSVAETSPSLLLRGEKPILFDEWQDAPKLWGAIRKYCDDHAEAVGEFFLTGSTGRRIETAHTGTGRISEVNLYPMTLFETGESNGSVSLGALFQDETYEIDGCTSDIELEDLIYAACRGGWPRCLAISDREARLEIARDYHRQIYGRDISSIDGVDRNPEWARILLWSYARNMATITKKSIIYADVKAQTNVSDVTLATYIEKLEELFVIKDIDAWTPQIRSKTAIRSSKKHIFVDPSIGIAALGLSPEYFYTDMDLFGHVFENMVLRDLIVYASVHGGKIMHYRDDTGLEVDAIYQMADGRYALIEIKTGTGAIPAAEEGLLKFEKLIEEHNEAVSQNTDHPGVLYRKPSLRIIICANAPMAYTTEKGTKIIPIGCLRD